ncbi:D-alanine--D-alanine ligase [Tissierella carlieri]|jgi:D-alanine-D-alanine ligase|uniref:D-alanine--D-alanine ligase n=1 Tax=Tissierella carlieri TaxID=689904 RepID=UPI00386E9DB5
MKTNIYVLCGGKSVEHDISLKSASAIMNAIDREKYNVYPIYITNEGVWCNLGLLEEKINAPDELRRTTSSTVSFSIGEFLTKVLNNSEKNLVIPALHGPNGEDGTIQGFLELLDIPYLGNEVLSSAVAMDKVMTKDLFSKYNIPQVKYLSFRLHSWQENEEDAYNLVENEIGYPCYVKPSNGGSSVGISRAENREELKSSFKEAFLYDRKIIIEKEIVAREMQISVIGNNHPKASVPGEFIMERPFFDYNAKYIDGKLIPVIPARLEPEVSDKVRETAVKAFKILNCHGLARVDIFVTDENEIFVNEVNTMPGFTAVSMTPVLWGATDGTTYAELIERLIQLALERYNEKKVIVNTR